MIQLNILYPKKENSFFNWDYYLQVHMPLSVKLQGDSIKGVSIAKGMEAIEGAPVAYIAVTAILYNSVDDFMKAFTPHAAVLQGDMKNYTNSEPVIQFSKTVMTM